MFVRCWATTAESGSWNFTKQTRDETGKGESLKKERNVLDIRLTKANSFAELVVFIHSLNLGLKNCGHYRVGLNLQAVIGISVLYLLLGITVTEDKLILTNHNHKMQKQDVGSRPHPKIN